MGINIILFYEKRGMMFTFNQNEKKTCGLLFRKAIYFAIMVALIFGIRFCSFRYRIGTFQEFGIIENIQLTLLGLATFVFAVEGLLFKKENALLFIFASFTLFALCRELDSYFEINFPSISWKFAFLFPILALIYLYYKRKTFKDVLFQFFKMPAFDLFFMAVCLFALAQCFGHRPMITAVLPKNVDTRYVRRIFEEGTEVICYLWIFLISIELFFNIKRKN